MNLLALLARSAEFLKTGRLSNPCYPSHGLSGNTSASNVPFLELKVLGHACYAETEENHRFADVSIKFTLRAGVQLRTEHLPHTCEALGSIRSIANYNREQISKEKAKTIPLSSPNHLHA